MLSDLKAENANLRALLQLDLISRILCLRDCVTNSSNCGQLGENPIIVDFRIESSTSYFKRDILGDFHKGHGEFNYIGLMSDPVRSSTEVKLSVLHESLQKWNLNENLSKVEAEVDELIATDCKNI